MRAIYISLALNIFKGIENDKISVLSSINFFIYCFASKRFRGSLRSFLASLLPPKRSRETNSTSNLPMSEISPLNQNQWISMFTSGSAHLAKMISRDQRIDWNGWYARQLVLFHFFDNLTCFRRVINFCQSTSVTYVPWINGLTVHWSERESLATIWISICLALGSVNFYPLCRKLFSWQLFFITSFLSLGSMLSHCTFLSWKLV